MKTQGKVYFGWCIVVVSFLLLALVYAPSISLAGLPIVSIAQDFQVSTTAAILPSTIGLLGAMVGSVFAGKVLMRFGIRRTVPVLLIICGVLRIITANAPSITFMYGLSVLSGVFGAATSFLPISILINSWFGPKLRGKAMGTATIGISVGAIVLSPIVANIIAAATWRGANWLYAVFYFISAPMVWFTFYESPEKKGLTRLGDLTPEEAGKLGAAQTAKSGLTAGEALRTPMFWLAILAIILINGMGQVWSSNSTAFSTSIGYTAVQASFLVSLCSLAGVVGKVLYGVYSDIRGARSASNLFLLPVMAACVCLVAAHWMPVLAFPATLLYGLSFPNSTVGTPLVTSELFGSKNYGILVGYTQVASTIGSSLLPLLISYIYERNGSYMISWVCVFALAVFAMVMINSAYIARKRYR